MNWDIKSWMCGGFRATREDGEMVFIYKRPDWGTGLAGLRRFYELRSRGVLVGRISAESSWRPLVTAQWLGETDRRLNEADLLEITAALKL
ncbi:MAG: hypothetical protein A2X35_09500 [Elusimicrobia bacterium GWA2_61_42]|nr:MAG: hypothetical protein A2X35_09500 [Elusimicrobia bacterium GWA2_61_42]OGR74924.1 MAG: hypothetical protein A2X38_05710 [Elusimicrobia bacterium GWC2_61_25]